jgi:Chaperone of endosialidase
MTNTIKILRSSTASLRPTAKTVGEPYVNFADNVFGVVDGAGTAVDLIGPGLYLPLTGGTLIGPLNISGAAATGRNLIGQTAGLNRWVMSLGNATAETGGNAGSDFIIQACNDTGALIPASNGPVPLSIARSNGVATFGSTINVSGFIQGSNTISTPLGGVFGFVTCNGVLNVTGASAFGNNIQLNAPLNRQIWGSITGQPRWSMTFGDTTAESGGNAGSNFSLSNYNDAGIQLSIPLSIARATGIATFSQPIVNGSDRRLKENIAPIADALNKVTALKGVSYNMIGQTRQEIGLIAQDVQPIVPEIVHQTPPPPPPLTPTPHGVEADSEPYLGIAYSPLTALLVEAVKELSAKVTTLQAQVDALSAGP